ncbi:Ribosomal-protein-alanine acetyltransferase [Thalassocella blandensis]|nr:Ribosomal-protein-alanine acetyltransferase [Thalassocella blandensis]
MLAFSLRNSEVCEFAEFGEDALEAVLAIENAVSPSPWSRQNFLDSIHSSHYCYAAYHAETILGFAIFSCAAGEAELLLIAVNPTHQRLGVAEGLLHCAQSLLGRKAQELFLEVRESNESAIGLYEKLEFNCIGRRPNYYPSRGKHPREDALIYAKHMTSKVDG